MLAAFRLAFIFSYGSGTVCQLGQKILYLAKKKSMETILELITKTETAYTAVGALVGFIVGLFRNKPNWFKKQ